MKIKKEVLQDIFRKMPAIPPEAGGIIGGRNGIVSVWKFDGNSRAQGCRYQPDVKYFNTVIENWMEEGYDFMGILHVHFGGAKNLSDGDIKYIERIMHAMPITIKKLYFPIALKPENLLIAHIASIDSEGKVIIGQEELTVFDYMM